MYAKLERRVCRVCREEKELKEFRHRKDRGPNYYEVYCRPCERVRRKNQYLENKPYWKQYDYKRNCLKFGITSEVYEQMVIDQNGKCAICEKPETATRAGVFKKLAIDHCHKTGKIRALLCNRCNTAIGLLKEDYSLFKASMQYLKKFKSQR